MFETHSVFEGINAHEYHSAIFTAFSINLYYWENQVMRFLHAKGIENLSALIDCDCLSEQFELFSSNIGCKRPKDYSIHGVKANGAFHPKIMFFAGQQTIMAKVGSGNLTVCGHGKNLEIWTSIKATSLDDSTYPILIDIWNYLRNQYSQLGEEGSNFIDSLMKNCLLLQNVSTNPVSMQEYAINEDYSLRLLADWQGKSIFSQIIDWIGRDKIREIAIMSPFYDENAVLINELNNRLNPNVIRIVVQENFGNRPDYSKLPQNTEIYLWNKDSLPNTKQELFHSKTIFLKGENFNYLVAGSANASFAAMGNEKNIGTNHEASIGYKSDRIDFWKKSGIELKNLQQADVSCSEKTVSTDNNIVNSSVWIKEASWDANTIKVLLDSEIDVKGSLALNVISSNKSCASSQISRGNYSEKDLEIKVTYEEEYHPLYVYLSDKDGVRVSNNQFVINSWAMINNDPSPENLRFKNICRQIERGNLLNSSVLKFISEVLLDTVSGKEDSDNKRMADTVTKSTDETQNPEHNYSSFEEYKKGNEVSTATPHVHSSSNYNSSIFIDTILHKLAKDYNAFEDEVFDDEETEDAAKSQGKERKQTNNKEQYNKYTQCKKIRDALIKYVENLEKTTIIYHIETKVENFSNVYQLDFISELQRMMTAIVFATYHIGCSISDDSEKPKICVAQLFPLGYLENRRDTATEVIYRLIALFGVSIIHNKPQVPGSRSGQERLEYFKSNAFELAIGAISVCDLINDSDGYSKINGSLKATALFNIKRACNYNFDADSVEKILKKVDVAILRVLEKESLKAAIEKNMMIINAGPDAYGLDFDERLGYFDKSHHKRNFVFPITMAARYGSGKYTACAYGINDKSILRIKP